MASIAVGLERVSRVVGYLLDKGNFATATSNLPQRIAIIGEANHANQSSFTENTKYTYTSSKQVGDTFGYGSPLQHMFDILYPANGGGIGGIPVDIYPQAAAVGATSRIQTLTVTGTATAGGTHYVRIAGRTSKNGKPYEVNISSGDTATQIAAKIKTAIDNVLSCPLTAAASSPADNTITTTTKWKGKTAQKVSLEMDTNNTSLGVTYAVVETQAGAGTPGIGDALDAFGNVWYTQVMCGYGLETTVMDSLEAFNGIPDPTNPTGRYTGIIMKPFIAVIGDTSDDASAITDARSTQVTIAVASAPLSKGLPCEAAANYGVLYARQAQDTPNLDIAGKFLPDMPVPSDGNIGSMATYNNRDAIVKKGCSTVDLVSNKYQVQDFVTTYHPTGEEPPQYRYCSNLNIDMNVRYKYYLRELESVVDHQIAADTDIVNNATNVIKPKQWKQVLVALFKDCVNIGIITDSDFSIDSLSVNLSTTNPDRLETTFSYKRRNFARIAATTAKAGFNFGS